MDRDNAYLYAGGVGEDFLAHCSFESSIMSWPVASLWRCYFGTSKVEHTHSAHIMRGRLSCLLHAWHSPCCNWRWLLSDSPRWVCLWEQHHRHWWVGCRDFGWIWWQKSRSTNCACCDFAGDYPLPRLIFFASYDRIVVNILQFLKTCNVEALYRIQSMCHEVGIHIRQGDADDAEDHQGDIYEQLSKPT